jgi:uncharacterized membrane protein
MRTASRSNVSEARKTSAPIPPPDVIARYEKALPGLADRIVKLAESEATHRWETIRSSFIEARIGQFAALTIGITAILSGTYAATHGAQAAGSVIGGGGVVGLVSVFVLGRFLHVKKQPAQPWRDS